MDVRASQITILAIVYSTVHSGEDQRKHQSSASLAFVRGIHRWPVNSLHKWPATRKMFPFDDVIMIHLTNIHNAVFCNRNVPNLCWLFLSLYLCTSVGSVDALQKYSNFIRKWSDQLFLHGHGFTIPLSSSLALCEGNPPVKTSWFASHRFSDAEFWWFLCCQCEQAVKQTVE